MKSTQKDCFGILDRVFPKGKEGLREVVPACLECPDKKSCLQAALQTEEGFRLRREVLDRSPAEGLMGRLKRWSERKELSRLSRQNREKRK